MIANDTELQTTQERIAKFQQWLAGMRKTARPEEFVSMSSGYRLEIERMQAEVLDFLLTPSGRKQRQSAPANHAPAR